MLILNIVTTTNKTNHDHTRTATTMIKELKLRQFGHVSKKTIKIQKIPHVQTYELMKIPS